MRRWHAWVAVAVALVALLVNVAAATAYFYDSAGNDDFVGFSRFTTMKNADGENDIAAFFSQVYAFSFVGGHDTASVFDTNVNHVLGFTRIV